MEVDRTIDDIIKDQRKARATKNAQKKKTPLAVSPGVSKKKRQPKKAKTPARDIAMGASVTKPGVNSVFRTRVVFVAGLNEFDEEQVKAVFGQAPPMKSAVRKGRKWKLEFFSHKAASKTCAMYNEANVNGNEIHVQLDRPQPVAKKNQIVVQFRNARR
ncbi:hypothetical protein KIPB_012117 [Kipferlia bialata]|uniref:RRM domain-containing protein n=1 Tax=Kipferlia bialata TaxID=797122 RepID=A0A391NT86_9EUKA|nr:hypothetical protein KIPB_012117 [Kipferlia bialata]|eukprot:g12117.t1